MDKQSGWIIVIFDNDNSVEAVPDIWLKKIIVRGQLNPNKLKNISKDI